MKHYSILLLFFCFGSQTWAESFLVNTYQIISDIYVDSIPAGKCVIQGKVFEAYSQEPVISAYVGNVNYTSSATTNEKGEFRFIINEKERQIFFYHESYGEIIVRDYDFKSKHCITLNFITSEVMETPTMVEKPVIYLYANREVDAVLTLTTKGKMIFSYPEYNQGWKVKVMGKGGIYVEEKSYPYLFWESEQRDLDFSAKNGIVEGYYLNTDSTIQFLESTLAKAGLNATEKTDFITYWAPRMMRYQFATVQFLLNEDYARMIASIAVSPTPESELRLFMLFKGHENDVSPNFIVEPKWTPFSRSGFTLVEWGGAELISN